MKKISVLLIVIIAIMGSAAFAAAKTMVKVPAASAAPAESKLAITSWGGLGGLSYAFNDQISAMLGANYTTTAGVGFYGLVIKADYNLVKVGKLQTNMGVYYTTISTGVTGTLGLTFGVETMVQSNLLLGMDFILANQTNTLGVATSAILPATAVIVSYYL
ncbi:MAG: hypothetical protein QME05_04615 [Candidatus Margulisbacteria bacterium]|nr:hypothetical protein [Candidatus Margulisiibacteriota bacterium]